MDGHFVPNLSIGAPVVKCLRPRTDLYLDCHLMIDNPGDLLDDFAKAGADSCTVHVELGDPRPLFDRMRAHGMRVGLVLNPETPLDAVLPYLEEIDILLFMSVHPGFGGQAFIPEVLDKVRAARARSSTSAGWRSSSRSTAASTSRPRRWPPRPAPTSSWPAARSSTPPIRSPRRRAIRAAAWPELVASDVPLAKVLTVSDGVAAGVRDDKSGRRARRPADRGRASRSPSTG